jgi:glycerophosphoryl diester phosphodiesterase
MTTKTLIPLAVAHRGDLENYPENTLSAFKSAIDLGADAIELDVFLTNDDELVVHHDHTLERTTNGTGYIGDLTLSELRQLDAGSWFNERFKGERIPTLGEVLGLGKGRVRFELELRTPTRAFVANLLAELARYDVEEEVELTSPHLPLLGAVRAVNLRVRTGLFVSPFPDWLPLAVGQQHVCDYLTLLGANVVHLPASLLERTFVERLHEGGWLVHASDINTEAGLSKAIETGVDQFSTNRLGWALSLKGRNLEP